MEQKQLQCIIEGALLAAAEPLTLKRLAELFIEDELIEGESEIPEKESLLEALQSISENCEGRGFELKEVASGWRFQVRQELATWVNRLWEEKPQKYTRALLETLSLIAYRQPITRGDIEEIRGVAVSSSIIRTLLEREWVKVIGHRDVPGRPSLYATTREFLDYFNLKSLDELPTLSDIKDFEEMNAALDLHIQEQVSASGNEPSLDENSETQETQETQESEAENLEGSEHIDEPEENDAEPEVSVDENVEAETQAEESTNKEAE